MNKVIFKVLSYLWHLQLIQIFVPTRIYCSLEYKRHMGKKLNLNSPKTLNEKLQWLKIYDKNPIYTRLADKYEVRQYIEEKIGNRYLVPLIGVYENVNDINFKALPSEYVLKCTHDSGTVIIKNSKSSITIEQITKKLNAGMKRKYYYFHREWCYKNIRPRIICEKLIYEKDNKPPKDYKIFCFNGEPKFLFVASDRGNGTKFDFFDMQWVKYPVKQHYPNSNYEIKQPKKWEEMVSCAKKLSKGLTHVRVDFYVDACDDVYVGELTFCHFGGFEPFEPEKYDDIFGKWLKLPIENGRDNK